MSQGRILVVDDASDIAQALRTCLEREGFEVAVAGDGRQALDLVARLDPGVVVLDLMMPQMDGFEVCRQLRRTRTTPILILSARDDAMDKVLGLELGADDYLTKPFHPRELVARVRALLRRARPSGAPDGPEEILERGELRILPARQRVEVKGTPVSLTPLEFQLLKTLAARPDHVLSRQDLLDRIWGPDYVGDPRTVDTHLRNLRVKLQKVRPGPHYIKSVWGVGYRFEA